MANQEQLQRLKRSVQEWNAWRNLPPVEPAILNLSQEVEIDLSKADLCKADLDEAHLQRANLSYSDISGATLKGANLGDAILKGTMLLGSNLSNARLLGAVLDGASFHQANLDGATLHVADIKANFTLATLKGADLSFSIISGANLKLANLQQANLSDAKLDETYFWRANLQQANLSKVVIRRTVLDGANLSGANLNGVRLIGANLSNARLIEANLDEVNLSNVRLDGACLDRAYLNGVNLSNAHLSNTDMSNVSFSGTTFADNDFRLVKGLATAKHRGPSHINLYSVQLPQDGSALHFLRGVGVPEEWIDFYRAQMIHPIQYHSVFISYSSHDELLAQRLHADLQAQGVRCWFASHDARPGAYIRQEIDQAIHLQDKTLLLLSKDAIASGWVEHEVEIAQAREREQRREILFPIRLDAAVLQTRTSWAASLRKHRHIGDFTAWKNAQAYQIAFERLLRGLKDTQS